MPSAPGVTVYPTAYNWEHSPWADHGQGSEFSPNASKALSQANPGDRGSTYYVGFLVTLAILLFLGVICGTVARRRHLARLHQRNMDASVDQAGAGRSRRFGGPLGMNRAEGNYPQETGKTAPKLHDMKLDRCERDTGISAFNKGKAATGDFGMGSGDSPGFENSDSRDSRSPWGEITPLSASLVRPPRDLEPYAHLESLATTSNGRSTLIMGDAPPPYWFGDSELHNSAVLTSREALPKRWFSTTAFHRLYPSPAPVEAAAYQLSSLPRERSASARNIRSIDSGNGVPSSTASTVVGEEGVKMEVAVVVGMPDRFAKGSNASLPEYEIGIATANVGKL